jgi:RNA polymerase primary sigma factor
MIVETDGLAGQERKSVKNEKRGSAKKRSVSLEKRRRQPKPERVAGVSGTIPKVDEETDQKPVVPVAGEPVAEPAPVVVAESTEEQEPTAEELAQLEQEAVEVPREVKAPKEERTRYDGESAIRLYLREIGKVPLLTIQDEIDLAALIQAGDMDARERMIKANLRLVVKIAHDYDWLGLPLLDLINEGNIGLMKAVEKFDPAKGGKLSTYAAWWIKQGIKRALANQSKTIRLPVHLVDKISKMRRVSLALQEQLGREATDEEIGEEMQLPTARVSQMRTAAIRPASLDAPLGDESDSNSFGEVIEDQNAESPYEMLEEKTIVNMLQDLVKTLPDREATILNFRFGLDGGNEKTLEEVGHKFGVTRERVRQIQNIALNKLRKKIEKIERVET